MLSNEAKDRIGTEIGKLLEGLELRDAAAIMTIQLATLCAHSGHTAVEAIQLLDDIRDDAVDIIETLNFDEVVTEKAAMFATPD